MASVKRASNAVLQLALASALLAGCGGGSMRGADSSPSTTVATATSELIHAARSAVMADHAMSQRVLWTNAVPAHTRYSGGPSMVALRRAVRARVARGIRIRVTKETFRIVSVSLDPSYMTAFAVVDDRQLVQPYGVGSGPLGKALWQRDHVRLTLKRSGTKAHFVVWKVTTL